MSMGRVVLSLAMVYQLLSHERPGLTPAPKRRWLQFSLLALFVALGFVVGLPMAYSGESTGAVLLLATILAALFLWIWTVIEISHAVAEWVTRKSVPPKRTSD